MATNFLSGTPLSGLEKMMRLYPGAGQRRSGYRNFVCTAADCDCKYCTEYKGKKEKCRASDCVCFPERLLAGCLTYKELVRKFTDEVNDRLFTARDEAMLYLTAELFPLSYSFGVQVSHIIPAIVWILILLDIPMLLSIIWVRIKLFNGSLKTKKSYYSIGGTITLVLTITPLTNFLLNQTPIDMHYVIADICMFIFSYAMSVLLISFGNYYVAQKYKNIIRLYEDEKARTNRMRKGSHDTRKSKR